MHGLAIIDGCDHLGAELRLGRLEPTYDWTAITRKLHPPALARASSHWLLILESDSGLSWMAQVEDWLIMLAGTGLTGTT